MMGTRARFWVTMVLLAYPFLTIGASTCCFAAGEGPSVPHVRHFAVLTRLLHETGILVAAAFSESPYIRYSGYVGIASPLLCGLAFWWIHTIKLSPMGDEYFEMDDIGDDMDNMGDDMGGMEIV